MSNLSVTGVDKKSHLWNSYYSYILRMCIYFGSCLSWLVLVYDFNICIILVLSIFICYISCFKYYAIFSIKCLWFWYLETSCWSQNIFNNYSHLHAYQYSIELLTLLGVILFYIKAIKYEVKFSTFVNTAYSVIRVLYVKHQMFVQIRHFSFGSKWALLFTS